MSVGLLVFRLLYCFYVLFFLSKWFTFTLFFCSLLSVVSLSFTLAHNGLALGAVADFGVQNFHLTTKVDGR